LYLLERTSKLLCYRNIPPNQPHPHPTFPTHAPCSTNFRSQIITIDSSDITSNGLKPLNTREDMGYCESKLFTWTEIEKAGYTKLSKAFPYNSPHQKHWDPDGLPTTAISLEVYPKRERRAHAVCQLRRPKAFLHTHLKQD